MAGGVHEIVQSTASTRETGTIKRRALAKVSVARTVYRSFIAASLSSGAVVVEGSSRKVVAGETAWARLGVEDAPIARQRRIVRGDAGVVGFGGGFYPAIDRIHGRGIGRSIAPTDAVPVVEVGAMSRLGCMARHG